MNSPSPTPIITNLAIEKNQKLMMKIDSSFLFPFILIALALIGCSDNPLLVSDTKWDCRQEKSGPICEVKFTLENSSHFPISANALIRAHRRRTGGLGEVSNHLVGEKNLSFTIQANERMEVEEVVEVQGKVTQVVVTAWGDKI